MRFARLLTSPLALGIMLLLAVGWFTVALTTRAARESASTVPADRVEPKQDPRGMVKEVGTAAVEMAMPTPPPANPEEKKEIPLEIRRQMLALPSRMTIAETTMPASAPSAPAPAVSSKYLPYGVAIPCKLVNTIDSNSDGTPVIAITLEDMRNIDEQGVSQLVIPAGTMAILDATAPGRERDRINADGTWVFVWRTRDQNNGLELPIPARALSRVYDPTTGLYGMGDGRAGLRGDVIDSVNARLINAAAQSFITDSLNALQTRDVRENPLTGNTIRNVLPTMRNAVLGGTSAAVQEYAQEIQKRIQENGAYVQVPAGTEFYLFPRQTVDFRNARRGATANLSFTSDPQKK